MLLAHLVRARVRADEPARAHPRADASDASDASDALKPRATGAKFRSCRFGVGVLVGGDDM